MYTKIYDDTIITKYVKYLLSKFNIPIVPFFSPSETSKKMFTKKGGLYIYNSTLYRCDKSGSYETVGDTVGGVRAFTEICPFVYGAKYDNLTTTRIGDSGAYTPMDHYWLGEYIRTFNAYYNMNLMPFYNCFNGVFVDDVNFTFTFDSEKKKLVPIVEKSSADGYKVCSVPIKFGKEYSIYVDSDTGFEVLPCFYGRNGYLSDRSKMLWQYSSINSGVNSPWIKYYSKFSKPEIIPAIEWKTGTDTSASNIQESADDCSQYERILRLLIKVPTTNNSSIVVLEGNYSNIVNRSVEGTYSKYNLGTNTNSQSIERYDIIGPLKFNWINDGETYAFTDTLPQYLLLSVISQADTIDENIARVQEYITSVAHRDYFNKVFKGLYTKGIWNDSMRNYIVSLIMNEDIGSTKVPNIRADVCGYVDVLGEAVVTKGQDV